MATAGVGGVHRSISPPQLNSLPVRFAATIVAGGALAAAGQHAFSQAMPPATDSANALSIDVRELVGGSEAEAATAAAAPLVTQSVGAISPVAPEPVIADAAELVKAADLHRVAAETAARAAEENAARAAEEAKAAEAARAAEVTEQAGGAVASVGGAVQLVVGRVTSGFGSRWGSSHQGLDIAAPIGTPIHVPLGGTVVDSGSATGFGLWVRVRHSDGTITTYGHVNRSLVKVGQQVAAGEVIAEVGNRGRSTGPHLHIEVTTPAGKKINPRPWLDERGIVY